MPVGFILTLYRRGFLERAGLEFDLLGVLAFQWVAMMLHDWWFCELHSIKTLCKFSIFESKGDEDAASLVVLIRIWERTQKSCSKMQIEDRRKTILADHAVSNRKHFHTPFGLKTVV